MKAKFMSYDGRYVYTRESRWIQIRYKPVTERHSLYDYADKYDMWDGKPVLTYFVKDGKEYALRQFMRFNYPYSANYHNRGFQDREGFHILDGYDATDSYKPYLIEISDDGECVRLYTEEVVA